MLRVMLVDDETLALDHLEKCLMKTGEVHVVGKYSSGADVLHHVQKGAVDAVFLDIEMPDMNGLDLASRLIEFDPHIFIIFVTAYRDYAVQAFDYHSVDYLVKPFTQVRLQKTIQRLKKVVSLTTGGPELHPGQRAASTRLRIRCFPELQVFHCDVPVKWKTAKMKELFAFLLTYYNQPLQRDTLIDNLWPDIAVEKAKTQLHTAVSYLRREIALWHPTNSIEFSAGSYVLCLEDCTCDIFELDYLLAGNPSVTSRSIRRFERIAEVCKGDFLALNGYDWSISPAMEWRHKVHQLLQLLIGYYDDRQDAFHERKWVQRLFELEPYSDSIAEQLMQLHIDCGDRRAAMGTYLELKDRLDEELGILPSPSIIRLFTSLTTQV